MSFKKNRLYSKNILHAKNRLYPLVTAALLWSAAARAEASEPTGPSSVWNPFALVMIGVIVALLIVIKSLANLLLVTARQSWAKQQVEIEKESHPDERKQEEGAKGGGVTAAILTVLLLTGSLFLPRTSLAEGPAGVTASTVPGTASMTGAVINGLSDTAFYMTVSVVGVELLVILYLVFNLNVLLKEQTARAETVAGVPTRNVRTAFSFRRWWTKINRFRPVEQEADLDLGHDYDGIRELDNKLPPWWLYGFYCTMIFACIYLWRYHVVHSAPLPAEEYQIAVREAETAKAEYLKKSADNVDENTVKLLTSQPDLDAGKTVFQTTCFACHGKNGEGGVGPNLTDDYWLHGGSINDVFKTIKYGWPEKGMKSWKDDFSPLQIAQIASYVKSLGGTHPANSKAPQGELVR